MKKTLAPLAAGALALGGVLFALPAMADTGEPFEPVLICDVWGADTHNLRVMQTGPRSFEVQMADLLMFAAGPGEAGSLAPDYYVPIPESIRFATNTITLGDGAQAANITLSQGVETGEGEDGSTTITSVTGGAINPGEAFVYDEVTGTIVWTQDTDMKVVDGDPIPPAFPPYINMDASTGVLTFDVTFPTEALGEVNIVSGIAMMWNTHRYTISSEGDFTWDDEPIEILHDSFGPCSVELLAVPGGEVTEEPTEEPTEVPSEEPTEEPTTPAGESSEPTTEPTTVPAGEDLSVTGISLNAGAAVLTALVLAVTGAGALVLRRRNEV